MVGSDQASTHILLIRHGQTVWNKEEVFRGRTDLELDETGLAQAAAVARALGDERVSRIVSSPLKRAIQTAQPLADVCGVSIETDPELTDIDFGRWQGMPVEDVAAEYPELFAQWEQTPEAVRFPDGEVLDEAADRAFASLLDIIDGTPGASVAVIAHRVINKVLICRILGIGVSHFWEVKQDTACINRFSVSDGRWVIDALNDSCHLKGIDMATGDF